MGLSFLNRADCASHARVTPALLDREEFVFRYREAMTKAGKVPPTEAEVEQVCRDVQEAIIAREQALHSIVSTAGQ